MFNIIGTAWIKTFKTYQLSDAQGSVPGAVFTLSCLSTFRYQMYARQSDRPPLTSALF